MTNVVSLFSKNKVVINHNARDMSVEASTFLEQIIRPALKITGTWSESAEVLMLGTALTESNLNSLAQIGGGPALSWLQVEKLTYLDCIRYLSQTRKRQLRLAILSACYLEVFPPHECLTWNIRLATLIARIKYWMSPDPLPYPHDAQGMANYHKKYYNTILGEADPRETVEHFREASLHR